MAEGHTLYPYIVSKMPLSVPSWSHDWFACCNFKIVYLMNEVWGWISFKSTIILYWKDENGWFFKMLFCLLVVKE